MVTSALPISNVIIECFFDHYKAILERNPQADSPLRSVLLIPDLCGDLTETDIDQALKQTSQIALQQ